MSTVAKKSNAVMFSLIRPFLRIFCLQKIGIYANFSVSICLYVYVWSLDDFNLMILEAIVEKFDGYNPRYKMTRC